MGPVNKPVSNATEQQISPEHIPSKHPKFVNARIGAFKDHRNYLQVSQSIGSISAYHGWQKSLQSIKKSIGYHSLYLPLQCEYQQEGFCGTAGILKVKFDYFPFLLDEEIANRQWNNLPFEEKQLWFLLYILVQTASVTHSLGHCIGDIKPKNIFINETGDISLYNTMSFPEEYTNFQKVRYFNEQNYLPPQGVNDIHTGKETSTYDEKIGQSFSIGLTILDAVFLTDHAFLYDKMQRFNEIVFKKILQTLSNLNLNQRLKQILLEMLSMNPEKRLSCTQVYQYLKPYEKQIFELQNFEIKGELKALTTIEQKLSTQNHTSPMKSGEKLNAKTKRQNLVRYSLSRSDKKNKVQQTSTQKMNQDNKNLLPKDQASNLKNVQYHQKEPQNYSVQASNSSTINKIQNRDQNFVYNTNNLPANTFEIIQLQSNNSKKITTNPTEVTNKFVPDTFNLQYFNKQQNPIQKLDLIKNTPNSHIRPEIYGSVSTYKAEDAKKQLQMTFKTGNLFKRQRSSASILQSPNREKISNLGYENSKFELTKPNASYEYSQAQKRTDFRPSVDIFTNSTGSYGHYNDFLKQIDKQIEDSKKLFPDSFK